MRIELPTYDGSLAFRLVGNERSLSAGDTVEIGPGLVARYDGSTVFRSVGIPEIVMFVLSIPANVVATVAANQIWSWIQSRADRPPLKIVVDGREAPFEEAAVKQLLIEELAASNDNGTD